MGIVMDKEMMKLEAIIEAILFTIGEAVECERIAKAIEQDTDMVKCVIHSMMDKYKEEDRGIQIIELNDSFQLCTKASMYEAIIRITHVPKKHVLTDVLLETLSIIAYKQPITKQEIEAIRGVKSDHSVNKLIEYNLVCEAGRLDAPGRPILFGTTEEFLRNFGVSSLNELPAVGSDIIENLKQEAEEEIQFQLNL